MRQVMTHFDFLISISKSSPSEAAQLLKNASDEEILALLNCLSLRKEVQNPPVTKKELTLIRAIKKRKRVKIFLKQHLKYIVPMIVVVLSKSIQEILNCVCDLS